MAAPYDLVIPDYTSIRTETDEVFGRLFAKTEEALPLLSGSYSGGRSHF